MPGHYKEEDIIVQETTHTSTRSETERVSRKGEGGKGVGGKGKGQ